jgi:hypothetical protein
MLLIIIAIALSVGSTLGLITKKFWLGTRDRQIKFYSAVSWTWKSSAFLIVLLIALLLNGIPDNGGLQVCQVLLIFTESAACVVLYPARPRGIS